MNLGLEKNWKVYQGINMSKTATTLEGKLEGTLQMPSIKHCSEKQDCWHPF